MICKITFSKKKNTRLLICKGVFFFMEIYIYSDIQGVELELPEKEPDLIFLLGDIYWRDVEKIDNRYSCPKIGVLGNHDRMDTFVGTNIIDLHAKQIEISGIKIAGFGGSPIYNHKPSSPQYSEMEIKQFTDEIKKIDIFLAHSNPAYEVDNDLTNAHRGFVSLANMMEEGKINYLFHGHIHENAEYLYKNTKVVVTHGLKRIEID